MVAISSWGRLTALNHEVRTLDDRQHVAEVVRDNPPGIAYGMGRSYGDVCLNPDGRLWQTRGLDRFIAFDEATGDLECEAGVLLRDIQKLTVPRGWMLPVTPGTQLVTVGGAIANDVHGKNHHVHGSFGNHVQHLTLVRTDGAPIECSPEHKPDWLAATIGGLGLTGVVLTARLRLRRVAGPWIEAETIPYSTLDEFFHLADTSESGWEYTVSWLDCLSGRGGNNARGLFMRGRHSEIVRHAPRAQRGLGVPFVPPLSLVNRLSLKPFNSLYFHLNRRRASPQTVHYEPFFYPLDGIHNWNRMYGPNGFYQYQCVVPRHSGRDCIQAMLGEIARLKEGSFLSVLKTFGERESIGMLSFPQPGVTFALDFPNRGERTLRLFEALDASVREAGGRIYPAKDARMPRQLFEAGYPRIAQFRRYRDPGISSAMSRRLMGD